MSGSSILFQAEVWAKKEYISAIGQPVNYLILGNLKTLDEETLHDIGNVELATQLCGLDNEVWRLDNLVKCSCQTGKVELVDTCKSTWQIGQANSTPECVVFGGGLEEGERRGGIFSNFQDHAPIHVTNELATTVSQNSRYVILENKNI
ncbi:unnamed protein product [Sphagnum troendelagicum]|uniref:Uncharacterized protein n=1 Tax=Sphagnum troendelagicum TaxID=128251 RepID=A0ABP0U2Q1_9BRYO